MFGTWIVIVKRAIRDLLTEDFFFFSEIICFLHLVGAGDPGELPAAEVLVVDEVGDVPQVRQVSLGDNNTYSSKDQEDQKTPKGPED